jgi:hypothetical protein
MEKYMLQNLIQIKKRNVIGDAGRINCSSFSNRIKEEAEGTATRCRPHRAHFGGFDTQGLVGGKLDHHNLRFDSQM